MKREELKELLRSAIYEGPTKQANKEKKRAVQAKVGKSMRSNWDADVTDLQLGRARAAGDMTSPHLRGDFGSKSKGAGDVAKMLATRGPSSQPRRDRKEYPRDWKADSGLARDMGDVQRSTQYAAQIAGRGGDQNLVAPGQVQAAVQSGGKVLFGRYYDAQGNYLGRTQGGKWVDAKTDPNAKSQMEMYNKLMEIEAGKYKSGDKEMVKEMIREVMRSCR